MNDDIILPKHIGIILDGNRRFAKKNLSNPLKGHDLGAKKVEELFQWTVEFNINELTLFTFSSENFSRAKIEVDYLMNLFKIYFKKLLSDKKLMEYGFKIKFVGKIELFETDIQKIMNELESKTKDNNKHIINFAMGYGGRLEIVEAVKKIAYLVKSNNLEINDIDEIIVAQNMYLQSEPDLIIRTSEQRLSGFLAWQSVYSEIIFLPDKLWPEFSKDDFNDCLIEFSNRKRRFGK